MKNNRFLDFETFRKTILDHLDYFSDLSDLVIQLNILIDPDDKDSYKREYIEVMKRSLDALSSSKIRLIEKVSHKKYNKDKILSNLEDMLYQFDYAQELDNESYEDNQPLSDDYPNDYLDEEQEQYSPTMTSSKKGEIKNLRFSDLFRRKRHINNPSLGNQEVTFTIQENHEEGYLEPDAPLPDLVDEEDIDSMNPIMEEPIEDESDFYDSSVDDEPLEDDVVEPFNISRDSRPAQIGGVAIGRPPEKEYQGSSRFEVGEGISVIRYIDFKFHSDIFKTFFQKFSMISPTDREYIEKTNQLIEQTVMFALGSNSHEICEEVKNYFGFEFSPSMDESSVLAEIIGDELRFYQQSELIRKFKSSDELLGNARKITKCYDLDTGVFGTSFEQINSPSLPNYAFSQNTFDKPFTVITDDKQLPLDFFDNYLVGSSILSNPAKVDFIKSENGFSVISTAMEDSHSFDISL